MITALQIFPAIKCHSEFPGVPSKCTGESFFVSCSDFRLSSLQECFSSSPFSPEVFTVSRSNWFFLTVPGTLNEQLEPSQAIAVKLCHAYLVCMAHPPRKPEVQSVMNFPSVFQFCHWHSCSFFPTVKGTVFQVQRLSKNVSGGWHQMSSFPHSWRSAFLLPLYPLQMPQTQWNLMWYGRWDTLFFTGAPMFLHSCVPSFSCHSSPSCQHEVALQSLKIAVQFNFR